MDRKTEVEPARAVLKRALLSSMGPSSGVILDALNGYVETEVRVVAVRGERAEAKPPQPAGSGRAPP